uniref:Uncharacterized protein n=1 Tax=Aegilops tauschii subsp. strangulata TaxID=200361 RepID=A0A452XWY4_AEGTS
LAFEHTKKNLRMAKGQETLALAAARRRLHPAAANAEGRVRRR